MRSSLIPILCCLWALAAAPPLAPPAAAAPPGDSGLALTVTVAPGAKTRASGTVPEAFPLRELGRRVPGIDLTAAMQADTPADAEVWARALDALTVVLPRLAQGSAQIAPGRMEVAGRLHPGFSAEATRAALRLALGGDWETRLDIAEAPPAAELDIGWTPDGAVLRGILPAGLEAEAALALVAAPDGRATDNGGLTGGGAGDAERWRAALDPLGRLLPAFRRAEVGLAEGAVTVAGALAPGHDPERLADWLRGALGEDWEVAFDATSAPARDGATRRDPVSGERQVLLRGRWLPLHDFPPGPATCGRQAARILGETPLGFVPGGAELAEGAAAALDRLAGLARHCLNRGGLGLEIGGHADGRGEAAENLALSERRAMAVLLELVLRGVRADAMTAVGYGETRPVADDATEAGRARNRRISLAWSES